MAKVSVLISDTQLLAVGARTQSVIITNLDGTNTVWVTIGGDAASLTTGFAVPAGQTVVLQGRKAELSGEFRAISETGTSIVSAYRIV